MIEINKELCINCGACVEDCAERVLIQKDGVITARRPCMQCGHCVAICPVKAVSIPEYDMRDVAEYDPVSFDLNPELFLNAVKFRRSIRKFKECPVEQEKLVRVVEAGRYTATAVNSQAVSYVMVQEKLNEFKPLAWKGWLTYSESLPEEEAAFSKAIHKFYDKVQQDSKQDRLFFTAPVLLVIAADNPWDGGLVSQNIEMMAAAEGLGVLYNGFVLRAIKCNPDAVEWLGLTGKNITGCMLLGYPDVRYKRTAPRKPADIAWK